MHWRGMAGEGRRSAYFYAALRCPLQENLMTWRRRRTPPPPPPPPTLTNTHTSCIIMSHYLNKASVVCALKRIRIIFVNLCFHLGMAWRMFSVGATLPIEQSSIILLFKKERIFIRASERMDTFADWFNSHSSYSQCYLLNSVGFIVKRVRDTVSSPDLNFDIFFALDSDFLFFSRDRIEWGVEE